MITANGKVYLADTLGPRTSPLLALGLYAAIAIGTGTPGASALGAEVSRRALRNAISAAGGVLTVQTHWDVEDQLSGTYSEIGLFAGSTMIASKAISVTKAARDPLTVTWNIRFP